MQGDPQWVYAIIFVAGSLFAGAWRIHCHRQALHRRHSEEYDRVGGALDDNILREAAERLAQALGPIHEAVVVETVRADDEVRSLLGAALLTDARGQMPLARENTLSILARRTGVLARSALSVGASDPPTAALLTIFAFVGEARADVRELRKHRSAADQAYGALLSVLALGGVLATAALAHCAWRAPAILCYLHLVLFGLIILGSLVLAGAGVANEHAFSRLTRRWSRSRAA